MITREYYAHSAPGEREPSPRWQLLRDHLRNVADLARKLAENTGVAGLVPASEAAGWLHDVGKYQLEWQNYLLAVVKGLKAGTVPHAFHGAAHAYFTLGHAPLAAVIAGHHTGLHDFSDLEEKFERVRNLGDCLKDATLEVPEINGELAISDLVERQLEFWTRVLFSLLIDADRLDTAGRHRSDLVLEANRLLQVLKDKAPSPKPGTSHRLNQLRHEVFEQCIHAGDRNRGFFELTVPTGGGKTRSAMAFALAHARRHSLRRIFIVIPYLSIIEQNAREYRNLFGSEIVLEHHSAVLFEDAKPSDAYRSLSPAELATENWDAPIVVTTSVQFLETLLAASTKKCRRLHSVAKSVIVFDEAQCLPVHLLNPLLDVFRQLNEQCSCSIVFSTATQPAFRFSPHGLTHGFRDEELQPILTENLKAELFRDLQRVEYQNETATPWRWETLVDRLSKSPALCVLNTRKHARLVWELLRSKVADPASVRHLSSCLCAEHRLDILGTRDNPKPGTIYHRLQNGQNCWVVSTQVIEAGVDIDFPTVYRALGPLDSIVQAAGRCNREGRSQRGTVVIFQPEEDSIPKGIYRQATGAARTILGELADGELATNAAVFEKYFSLVYGRSDTDPAEIQELRTQWRFAEVAEKAKVIKDASRSVIVPYGRGRSLIHRIRRIGFYNSRRLRNTQRFTVNLQWRDFQNARNLGLVEPLISGDEDGPWCLADGAYDENLGVTIQGLTPEQEII